MKYLSLLFVSVFFFSCTNDTEKILEPVSKKEVSTSSKIVLSSYCPPGFELNENNECINRNLYQQYESLQNRGVGGLKTALPKIRDGFSPQQIDLGRYLFFDPVLSLDSTISCASCHQPNKGFSDGLAFSEGIKGQIVPRSAPSLWNVAFLDKFFWTGHAKSLEEQMLGPLFNANEMGTNPELLLKTLNSIPLYKELFLAAFPDNKDKNIALGDIYTALSAFQCSLISLNSKYDQYAHGYHEALNQEEIEGMNVFRSFVARCAECHTPPLFSNQQIDVIGIPNSGNLGFDKGAEIEFKDTSLRGAFKVPSLRNVALTAPYEHNGVFKTLEEATEFYTKGRGHAVNADSLNLIIHWHIWTPELKDEEIVKIVAFLKTLTDESFKPETPTILPSGL